ncbi:hypothetical protein U9M48_011602 [Paspalum notatum var. saurae]|uniref:Uncharacterized protein n=1 Tax=Paspalum notatum var. saurae TaxID=547442 RepID=A0AAQ3SVU1_PASNO
MISVECPFKIRNFLLDTVAAEAGRGVEVDVAFRGEPAFYHCGHRQQNPQVKMAEDMVGRRAMSCGIRDLGLAPCLNSRKMCQVLNIITVTGIKEHDTWLATE